MIHLDEGDVVRLVESVAESRSRRPPKILFERSVTAYTSHHGGGTVHIPSMSFLTTFQALDTDRGLRLLVLHETTHWLMGPGVGHAPKFYAMLFSLCSEFGVDVKFALEDERSYKPRNAPKGYKMYLEAQE